MLSVFTPTNRPDYLAEAFASLKAQSHQDWEWVLSPNGPSFALPEFNDPRVCIVPAPESLGHNVGALKKFAVEQCKGDVLVELDHDDLLADTALSKIYYALRQNHGFVYSDFANFRADGSCEVYDRGYGWEHYQTARNGHTYTAHRAFEPDASSMHLIFFAPNHVRAWHRNSYLGYDPALDICDDFDLVCRTYIDGAPFQHIPECLYLYRLHADGSNTYLKRNADIQTKQQEVSNKYVYALIAEWCRRNGLPMYDLGGATGKPDGYLSIDLQAGADYVCDIREGLPLLADSSVGCIRAFDFLEHIPHCRDSSCQHTKAHCTVGLMNEIYRVLAPGGWLVSATPSTDGRGAFQDPTHCSFWNSNSMWYYTRRQQAQYVPGIKCRFQKTRLWNGFPSEWHKEHEIPYVYADLVALKGQRQPGICEI
jgi:SAM-dependent methyltransferase